MILRFLIAALIFIKSIIMKAQKALLISKIRLLQKKFKKKLKIVSHKLMSRFVNINHLQRIQLLRKNSDVQLVQMDFRMLLVVQVLAEYLIFLINLLQMLREVDHFLIQLLKRNNHFNNSLNKDHLKRKLDLRRLERI